jgi:hypothetical protein
MRIFISFLIATVCARKTPTSVNATASPSFRGVIANTTSSPGYGNSTDYPCYTEYGNYTANTTSSPGYGNSTDYPWYTEYGNYTANTTSYPGYGNIIEFPDFLGNR